jgi:hypothetical protein
LLVHKDAFTWRAWFGQGGPRRWEVVVFRNPHDQSRAYVKRVVGLPGERIELIGGDVYADGELRRKPLSPQLGARIPVDVHDYRPNDGELDPDWAPRWVIASDDSHWKATGSRFLFRGSRNATSTSSPIEWVEYRHWVRHGGMHQTSVLLESWPAGVEAPNPILSPLEYDADAHELKCLGAMPFRIWEEWDRATEEAAFRVAIRELFERSHVAPITDHYAYNHDPDAGTAYPVRDLMLELCVECSSRAGELVLELSDGATAYRAVLDFDAHEVRLLQDDRDQPLRRASLPTPLRQRGSLVQWSTFDRQLLLAIDGVVVCDPVECDTSATAEQVSLRPARLGARGGFQVSVDHLIVYRDVYYTPPDDRQRGSYNLQPDEFFVLGDNSPVSVDSRHWDSPGVPRSLLIGKPLIVHLPSRPGTLWWGAERRQIRVPDFSRIRYIR